VQAALSEVAVPRSIVAERELGGVGFLTRVSNLGS
jgi:hypothetical protein